MIRVQFLSFSRNDISIETISHSIMEAEIKAVDQLILELIYLIQIYPIYIQCCGCSYKTYPGGSTWGANRDCTNWAQRKSSRAVGWAGAHYQWWTRACYNCKQRISWTKRFLTVTVGYNSLQKWTIAAVIRRCVINQ